MGFFDPVILLNLSVPISLITVFWQKIMCSCKGEWKSKCYWQQCFCKRLMRLSHAQFAWPNIFPVYLKSWVLGTYGLAIKAHRKAGLFISVYCSSDMQRTAEVIAYRVFNSSAATLQERHALLSVQAGRIMLSLCGISGGHFCNKRGVVQDDISKGCLVSLRHASCGLM